MGTTRWGLTSPELTDEPNGPAQIAALAGTVDARLWRAYPCLSTARPALGAGDDGFLIRETDSGAFRLWDGDSWSGDLLASGGGGGGGGGGTGGAWAQYSAAAAQSIPAATNTPVLFATADSTTTSVTRESRGAGHQFKLGTSGLWTLSTTVRFATGGSAGERYTGIHLGNGDALAAQGPGTAANGAITNNVAVTRWFDADAVVFVQVWQGSGSARNLEPGPDGTLGKGWVRFNAALVAT
ncbi:hypothetical protein [Pseudonocardia pini]|uniref:hypothetical protein n=1 Tax=Pseudonocardia pini TaxID=2758030 RepID=UPI0015F09F80|nr:hypothetical protein [Pseudonocardia pini]